MARLACLLSSLALLASCADRRIIVTSDPPGARVWLNDVEVGRTPVQTQFTFYGDYDVRIELEGHEPVSTVRDANAPFYEWPGVDALAAVVPFTKRPRIRWHFDLQPAMERSLGSAQLEAELLDRARGLRSTLGPAPAREPRADAPTAADDQPPATEGDPAQPAR